MYLKSSRSFHHYFFLLGAVIFLCSLFGCKQEDPNALIPTGKSGYLCRLQIEGKQPLDQVLAVFRQRLRQAGIKDFKAKVLKRRKIQVEVKKIRLSSILSLLLQAQGRFGLYRFVEDTTPLYHAYQKLPQADQRALHLGRTLLLQSILSQYKNATSLPTQTTTSRPSTRASSQPQTTTKPSTSSTPPHTHHKRKRAKDEEYKELQGKGEHLFFGSSRTQMERALNSLVIPKQWRGKVRFLWKRTPSRRYWKVYLVHHKAILTESDLNQATTLRSNPDIGSLGTQLALNFKAEGAQRLEEASRSMLKKRLAIALDDEMYIAPRIQTTITTGALLLSPSYDLLPDERVRFLQAWRILLGLPPLEDAPTLLYVRRLRSF